MAFSSLSCARVARKEHSEGELPVWGQTQGGEADFTPAVPKLTLTGVNGLMGAPQPATRAQPKVI